MAGVPGTAARCAQCARVVNLPAASVGPASQNVGRIPVRPVRSGARGVVLFAGLMIVLALIGMSMLHVQRNRPMAGDFAGPMIAYPDALTPGDRLEQIWQAIKHFQSRHAGMWPGNLATLVREGDIAADVLADPRLGDTPAPGASNDMIAAQLDSGGHLSFVYLPPTDLRGVLVYERPAPGQSLSWVLYPDGRVEEARISFGQPGR
jgi:hypothetical protein